MADVDHPKTHVENQEDVSLPRTQPESPKHEGIDPLTESDTMYPAEDVKGASEKLARKDAKAQPTEVDDSLVRDQLNQTNPDEPQDPVSESADNMAEVDSADEESLNANADGKLPADAKVANDVGSDRGNTSPSNKPQTVNEPTDPDASNSVTADKTTKAPGAKKATPKADPAVRPTNNYPKSELK